MNKIVSYAISTLILISLLVSCEGSKSSPNWTVSTIAGGDSDARFGYPYGIAVDLSGNVYVTDILNYRIQKITPAEEVKTLAGGDTPGFADRTGTAARFGYPYGIAAGLSGNVYVADTSNHRIRKITPAGEVSTFAGGDTPGFADRTGTAARFYSPFGIAADLSGNIYVADRNNHRIRKITSSGDVSTLAGGDTSGFSDGLRSEARFGYPYGIAVDLSGNVYVADTFNQRIRKITSSGDVSTIAGGDTPGFSDGLRREARFKNPSGIAVDSSGNVYVADTSNHRIRKITSSGDVSTIAGGDTPGFSDGLGSKARFKNPAGIAVDLSGNIYVTDGGNKRIRKIEYKVP